MNSIKNNLIKISFKLIIIFSINLNADALKESYSLEYKGDYEGSYKFMESLISEKPNEYLYQYRAGWVSYMAGKFSQSVSHYSKAIVSEQSSLEPRLGQLKPLLALGKFREVEAVCKSIIQLDSKNYTARTTLAYSLYV
jgi:tetratricopeptide (TPR) repeat protein